MIILIPLSLTNTILLLWLALTVPLNAARRTLGVWLATLGLLGGGLFFARHTLLIASGIAFDETLMQTLDRELLGLWRVGWVAIVLLPLGWHLMLLWRRDNHLRVGRWGLILFALAAIAMLTATLFTADIILILYPTTIRPSAFFGYVPYVLGITFASVWHAYQQMQQSRQDRWLFQTSLSLHIVSWGVGLALLGVLIGLLPAPFGSARSTIYQTFDTLLVLLDSVVLLLLFWGIYSLGQALAVNEVFAERPLPRYGLQREWRRLVILALGFSFAITLPLALRLPTIYAILLSAMVMITFHALSTWRALGEQERFITRLRRFISGNPPTDLMTADTIAGQQVNLQTFAKDVLHTDSIALVPLAGASTLVPSLDQTIDPETQQRLSQEPIVEYPMATTQWAVGLRTTSGLIGALLLGNRADGYGYTAEEIELARAVGEQWLNQQMTAEIARRLLLLQHEHLTQQRLHDPRVRRLLHDDVLPTLQAAMLQFSGDDQSAGLETLASVHQQVAQLLRKIPIDVVPDLSEQGLVATLQDLVERDFRDTFATVTWTIAVDAHGVMKSLAPQVVETLYFTVREGLRNVVKHGGPNVEIGAQVINAQLQIWVVDEGSAQPSGAEGASAGLALNSTLLAVFGGTLALEKHTDQTRLLITLPIGK